MKISTSWIKEYTKIPNDKTSLYKLLDMFSQQCVDIDDIKEYGSKLDDIKIGQITKIEKHPDADKLKITKIKVSDKEDIQIVTGADNIYIGMICPVIENEGILPNGDKIKSTKLRGVESNGMLCSEKELLLGEDHTGIMDLGQDFNKHIGDSLSKYFYDVIIDIDNKIISTRPDLFSHRGIAREFSAINNTPFQDIKIKELKNLGINTSGKKIKVDIKDKDFCTRYMAVIVKNVKVEKSPLWLREKLSKIGIKSINNVVDISNLVLSEIGQPLHIFDLDKIGGEDTTIIVRKAENNETITTLDLKTRNLTSENYLIANKKEALGIAGIMGGKYSEIDNNTQNILIESATFDPVMIRKSSKIINLRTEASGRYEKGLPQQFASIGINYAIQLIHELASGKEFSPITDIISKKEILKNSIDFEFDKIEKVLGIKIEKNIIIDILEKLNFKANINGNIINIIIPEERRDINESVDIIEEIGRIYGYHNIPFKNPILETRPIVKNLGYDTKKQVKKILVAESSWEIKTYSFINKSLLEKSFLSIDDSIKIINPFSEEYTHLRNTLIPSMLLTIEKNLKNQENFGLFEVSNTYIKSNEELPIENTYLCTSYYSKNKNIETFFIIKKYLNDITLYLNLESKFEYIKGSDKKYYIPNQSAKIYINKELIGDIGNIHPQVKNNFNITGNITVAEINLDLLGKYIKKSFKSTPISKYPIVTEDINITYDKEYISKDIINNIKDSDIRDINIIDIYQGKPLKDNQISITVRITFENFEKTFIAQDIKEKIDKIKQNISSKFKNLEFR